MSKPIQIPGGSMTWLTEDAIEPGIGLSVARMTVDPGQISELHRHDNCSEIVYLLNGEISQRVGDKWIDMTPGDHCHIPPDHAHQTRNTGPKSAELLLVYSEGKRNYERLS